jgi:tryptophan synthase beta subunit
VIGDEARVQFNLQSGGLPDGVIACVGGGSNAIGMFRAFVADTPVALYGVEAAGEGVASGKHAATLTAGRVGVLHGARTMVLADDNGQIVEAHSVSAGLDYPGVGPEHSAMMRSGRATYLSATDDEALAATQRVARSEGILVALETAHAFARLLDIAQLETKKHGRPAKLALCLSGRGDKDLGTLRELAQAVHAVVGFGDAQVFDARECEHQELPHHGRVFNDQAGIFGHESHAEIQKRFQPRQPVICLGEQARGDQSLRRMLAQ